MTRGDLPDRDVDDIGDQALSFAEVKALATGDPLVLEKAGVDADVARLTRLERAHHDDQHRLRRTMAAARDRAARAEQRIGQLMTALDRLTDTRGDRFRMTVDGREFTKRGDAGDALQRLLSERLVASPPETIGSAVEVGTLGSVPVTGQAITTIADEIRVRIADAHIELTYTHEEWQHADPAMIVGRLERHVQRLPDTIAAARSEADAAEGEATRAKARIGQPFEHASQLTAIRGRQQELDEALAATTEPAAAAGPQTDIESPTSGSASAAAVAFGHRLDALSARASARSEGISR